MQLLLRLCNVRQTSFPTLPATGYPYLSDMYVYVYKPNGAVKAWSKGYPNDGAPPMAVGTFKCEQLKNTLYDIANFFHFSF